MDMEATNRSCEEDYEPQQETQEVADKQNTQKENQNTGEENDAKANMDSPYGVTDTNEENIHPQNLPEYTYVNLNKARRILGCQLCQGLMRKANVIKPCFHSICAECVDEVLKTGKKECPICRTNYSAIANDDKINNIVAILFPETEKSGTQASEFPTKDKPCNRRKAIDDKNIRYQVKRQRRGMADSCYIMSQSTPSSS